MRNPVSRELDTARGRSEARFVTFAVSAVQPKQGADERSGTAVTQQHLSSQSVSAGRQWRVRAARCAAALRRTLAPHSLLKLSVENSPYSVLESALEPVPKNQKRTENLPTTQTWFCLLQVSFVSWNCKRFVKKELVCLKQNFSREVFCH